MDAIQSGQAFLDYIYSVSPPLYMAVRDKVAADYSTPLGADTTTDTSFLGSVGDVLKSVTDYAVNLAPSIVKSYGDIQAIKDNALRAKQGLSPIYKNPDGSLTTVSGQGYITGPSGAPAPGVQQGSGGSSGGASLNLKSPAVLLGALALVAILFSAGRR